MTYADITVSANCFQKHVTGGNIMVNSIVTLMETIIYGGTVRSINKELNVNLATVETVDDLIQ